MLRDLSYGIVDLRVRANGGDPRDRFGTSNGSVELISAALLTQGDV